MVMWKSERERMMVFPLMRPILTLHWFSLSAKNAREMMDVVKGRVYSLAWPLGTWRTDLRNVNVKYEIGVTLIR